MQPNQLKRLAEQVRGGDVEAANLWQSKMKPHIARIVRRAAHGQMAGEGLPRRIAAAAREMEMYGVLQPIKPEQVLVQLTQRICATILHNLLSDTRHGVAILDTVNDLAHRESMVQSPAC